MNECFSHSTTLYLYLIWHLCDRNLKKRLAYSSYCIVFAEYYRFDLFLPGSKAPPHYLLGIGVFLIRLKMTFSPRNHMIVFRHFRLIFFLHIVFHRFYQIYCENNSIGSQHYFGFSSDYYFIWVSNLN